MTQWQLEYDRHVVRWLRKTDPQIARRIRDALTAVVQTGDPRIRGKALSGSLAGLWRYRIGDYRVICDIYDDRLVVLVIEIGNRDHISD
ncbi:type II toxin-antitoxin system RelE/ParE family toxin [Actinomyces sp. MRS3W]|uniref:type II toxin-antitoxin system RelE family toxin n=1 Tax=Actinomyces sp. MRS3W TaxID=2800796 RepID=UPI0028FD0393|nr:type II toxin-antitoxin system RelE/ParE family toxin [Actinomyces sp. MRS3W]MDU0348691.1 type II toxin-antitoxin system RelE/ParE family toxin [Actinomyces sp. MRS3W]